ncbi:MAG: FAD:protein FMN transferase [Verrucomicrobiia bacterium]
MEMLKAACNAMATRFEMVLPGENAVALRAAADEAIHEIERLHAQLSLYAPSSEVSAINARAATQAVKVEPRLFALLLSARQIWEETNGAFDITVAPLMRCWGFMRDSGAFPKADALAEARALVGMQHVDLDERRFTVRFARPGMMIDLGSIGKGYALEVAAETLLDAGIECALLHGGTSTICGMGKPPDQEGWKVAITPPPVLAQGGKGKDDSGERERPLGVVTLKNEALSVSAVHGKCFEADGKVYGHVIDPRTGIPAQGALLAAVGLKSATETDALSTALLLGGIAEHDRIADLRPETRTLVLQRSGDGSSVEVASRGIRLSPLQGDEPEGRP